MRTRDPVFGGRTTFGETSRIFMEHSERGSGRSRLRLCQRARDGDARLEESLHELALFEILGFGVHAPNVVLAAVDGVERREQRGPHRMILVVVAMKPVATAGLEVFEGRKIRPDHL